VFHEKIFRGGRTSAKARTGVQNRVAAGGNDGERKNPVPGTLAILECVKGGRNDEATIRQKGRAVQFPKTPRKSGLISMFKIH